MANKIRFPRKHKKKMIKKSKLLFNGIYMKCSLNPPIKLYKWQVLNDLIRFMERDKTKDIIK